VRALVIGIVLGLFLGAPALAAPALVPAPQDVHAQPCAHPYALEIPLRFPTGVDAGGFELVRERWRALGIPAPTIAASTSRADVSIERGVNGLASGGYTLSVVPGRVHIRARDEEAAFDALATLAQLPERRGGRWTLACTVITDAPALRWRIVSDDISRGPFPTMAYFKERIRTLAGFKINGYSPYMEHVFSDPAHPYVAFPEQLTSSELQELALYARRFHVALIPEQQTFAHMHETLKWETFAAQAELPHGYLLSPSDEGTYTYLDPLIRAELAAVGSQPFFHLGADEPLDLGRGRTPRTAHVFAAHVARVSAPVIAAGVRPMIWDDAIQRDPTILAQIPKQTVVVTFHYGAEPSFAPYIATIDRAGFDQLVSPGANNWNDIYPDLATAYANIAQFLADAKAAQRAHVLGMFMTVWHDDGESLYEATWSPLAFAAASAWQHGPVDRTTWHATFARAFFGSDDPQFGADLDALERIRTLMRLPPESDPSHYLFWADPFDARIAARTAAFDLPTLRNLSERVLAHTLTQAPPLHANAARVLVLAALRYDDLARREQIGREARADYDEARAHAATHDDAVVYRELNIAKYLCWELRDELTALEPLYTRAWNYESRPAGLDRVLVRYASAESAALHVADLLNAAQREDYLRSGTLPTFDTLLARPR
jgi:hypothetical protein